MGANYAEIRAYGPYTLFVCIFVAFVSLTRALSIRRSSLTFAWTHREDSSSDMIRPTLEEFSPWATGSPSSVTSTPTASDVPLAATTKDRPSESNSASFSLTSPLTLHLQQLPLLHQPFPHHFAPLYRNLLRRSFWCSHCRPSRTSWRYHDRLGRLRCGSCRSDVSFASSTTASRRRISDPELTLSALVLQWCRDRPRTYCRPCHRWMGSRTRLHDGPHGTSLLLALLELGSLGSIRSTNPRPLLLLFVEPSSRSTSSPSPSVSSSLSSSTSEPRRSSLPPVGVSLSVSKWSSPECS